MPLWQPPESSDATKIEIAVPGIRRGLIWLRLAAQACIILHVYEAHEAAVQAQASQPARPRAGLDS